MSRPTGLEIQRAIDFLSSNDGAKLDQRTLPPNVAYDSLVQRASELGHDLTAEAIQEAFRTIIRVRLAHRGAFPRS